MRTLVFLIFVIIPVMVYAKTPSNSEIYDVALKVMQAADNGNLTLRGKLEYPHAECLYAGIINGLILPIYSKGFKNPEDPVASQLNHLVDLSFDLDEECLKTVSFHSLNQKFTEIENEANKLANLTR